MQTTNCAVSIIVYISIFVKIDICISSESSEEQDKSSDTEQQPPLGDRKISNIQPQNRGGGYKTNRNII